MRHTFIVEEEALLDQIFFNAHSSSLDDDYGIADQLMAQMLGFVEVT